MKRRHFQLLCLTLLYSGAIFSQTPAPRELPAKRTTQKVTIDGSLNELAWKDAAMMTDLVEFRPKMGAKEQYENRSETWLMYDDEGIYFGGYLHERTRDSIATDLRGRDGFGMNDYIGIIFDTYYDKLNGFEYFVTPLNEQWDAKMAPAGINSNNGGEDFTWNAVWQSGVVIHNDGWSFEMFIPYSAIRFGKKEVQNWGFNITRRRRKTEQQYTWNPIDVNVNGFLTQEAIWTGVTNIKPPVRLQFSPYFSVYANHFPANQPGQKNWTGQVNGGLDVKYGINQAFTLDATLIPDFGQVQSDNQVLNLTPFEVRFNENRNFFTEGTELFSKGNLFYSRRIGGTPIRLYDAYDNVNGNEEVVKNPTESKLINASKISGRTQKGLGIGILNAITKPQYATIENTISKEQRRFETDPLTNYNVFVLDQTLKNNSSISLVNTNVWRSGSDYDANVTAALFSFSDKKNIWNIAGQLNNSSLFGYDAGDKTKSGYSHHFSFGKRSGRFNFNVWQDLTDTKYTSNDLGYFTNNNFLDHGIYAGYRWIQPRGWYNRIFINFNASYSKLFQPIGTIRETYQRSNINFNFNVQAKTLHWFGSFWNYTPYQNDFYEPRREGWFFRRGNSLLGGAWFESNASKKYSISTEIAVRNYFKFYDMLAMDVLFFQNYRFSSKFALSHRISFMPRFNNVGYAWSDASQIIFARRKVNTIENILNAKYSFTNKMGITFRLRHYVSGVENKEYFTLQQHDGKLASDPSFTGNVDRNVNFFNIDMVYTWQFAPGSFLNIVWKDAGYTYHDYVERSYFKNFGRTIESDQNNNISLKVIYFLDYLDLKKWRKKGKSIAN
ncbi:MAG: carbohydrate binding family 9 domain-containing protein [Chitinophagaceae bacterium]|nr:carbohydrate binding family 9 domain-containing protein [Chitinophagaceae bacterium]